MTSSSLEKLKKLCNLIESESCYHDTKNHSTKTSRALEQCSVSAFILIYHLHDREAFVYYFMKNKEFLMNMSTYFRDKSVGKEAYELLVLVCKSFAMEIEIK